MSIKALIADDSGVMRKIIVRAAKKAGVEEIIEAVDGVDALDKFAGGQFDIVLTDWNMPNKSGLEVIQGIRARSAMCQSSGSPRREKSQMFCRPYRLGFQAI